jgi:hypothetical protein
MPLFDGLLPRALPTYTLPRLGAGERGLVLGMGGGCDVVAAAVLARAWERESNGAVCFGNCIGTRPLPEDHELIVDNLYKLPEAVVPLRSGDEAYGSTRLELSVPRGTDGSPLLFIIPGDGKSGGTLEEVTTANCAAVSGALKALRTSQVIAVDLGGDSLTGGLDFAGGSPEFGRDRQVMHALAASGVPFVHLVFGPGCDGESSVERMQAAMRDADDRGALLGAMPLANVVGPMAELAKTLSPNRTPNILARAAEQQTGLFVITRHGNTAEVPCSWLTVGLALDGSVKLK